VSPEQQRDLLDRVYMYALQSTLSAMLSQMGSAPGAQECREKATTLAASIAETVQAL
jgi:hypothetical protein